MPLFAVDLETEQREDVISGEFRLRASFENVSDGRASLNLHTVSHPALVLDVRDARGEVVLRAPPSAPGPEDLEPGDVFEAGERRSVEYVGFLDLGLPAGRYLLRYFGEFPALGGTRDDPLRSDWLEFSVRRPRGIAPGVEVGDLRPPLPDASPVRAGGNGWADGGNG
jgi:hypothetical protein